jgi:hypothetical protein
MRWVDEIRGWKAESPANSTGLFDRMNFIGQSPGCGRAGAWNAAHGRAAESTKVDFVQL